MTFLDDFSVVKGFYFATKVAKKKIILCHQFDATNEICKR